MSKALALKIMRRQPLAQCRTPPHLDRLAPRKGARMSGPSHVAEQPIEQRAQLVDYLAAGGRPAEQWKIGTEHEQFVFRTDDLRTPPYQGERGIGALLKGVAGC